MALPELATLLVGNHQGERLVTVGSVGDHRSRGSALRNVPHSAPDCIAHPVPAAAATATLYFQRCRSQWMAAATVYYPVPTIQGAHHAIA